MKQLCVSSVLSYVCLLGSFILMLSDVPCCVCIYCFNHLSLRLRFIPGSVLLSPCLCDAAFESETDFTAFPWNSMDGEVFFPICNHSSFFKTSILVHLDLFLVPVTLHLWRRLQSVTPKFSTSSSFGAKLGESALISFPRMDGSQIISIIHHNSESEHFHSIIQVFLVSFVLFFISF